MKCAIVDTHAIIWYMLRNRQLGKKAQTMFDSTDTQLIVPTIVLCELWAYFRKSHTIERYDTVFQSMQEDTRFKIHPLTVDLIPDIPLELELHDGLIVATFLQYSNAVILSKDEKIKQWGPHHLVWN